MLVAKVGLDGHDVGARVIARGLVDAGMEVIYTGIRRTPQEIVTAARDEDVDVIGLSILSGAHARLTETLMDELRQEGLDHVTVIVGGIIPDDDVATLQKHGVARVFHPSTTMPEIVGFIEELQTAKRGHA